MRKVSLRAAELDFQTVHGRGSQRSGSQKVHGRVKVALELRPAGARVHEVGSTSREAVHVNYGSRSTASLVNVMSDSMHV
jgi:hypothetical protein